MLKNFGKGVSELARCGVMQEWSEPLMRGAQEDADAQ